MNGIGLVTVWDCVLDFFILDLVCGINIRETLHFSVESRKGRFPRPYFAPFPLASVSPNSRT